MKRLVVTSDKKCRERKSNNLVSHSIAITIKPNTSTLPEIEDAASIIITDKSIFESQLRPDGINGKMKINITQANSKPKSDISFPLSVKILV
jgi:hypothetical protein